MPSKVFSCGCAVISLVVSFVAYIISIGIGWALDQMVYPDEPIIRYAAIVSTIPVLTTIGYLMIAFAFGFENTRACAGCCMIICIFLSGLLEFTGGIMFIVAGAKLADQRLVAFGASAGVFSIIAGCSCCCSLGSFCAFLKGNKGSNYVVV